MGKGDPLAIRRKIRKPTAGGLLFGDNAISLEAVDAATGRVL
jgi:hypothetical protein